jgi:hypothetical protein
MSRREAYKRGRYHCATCGWIGDPCYECPECGDGENLWKILSRDVGHRTRRKGYHRTELVTASSSSVRCEVCGIWHEAPACDDEGAQRFY